MQNISQRVIHELELPDLGVSDQRRIETEVRQRSTASETARSTLARLVTRLVEYRDALITEAVTGQLDITATSGSQMDERLHEAIEAPRG